MRISPYPLPSAVASSSYTVSAEGYPDYTANAITSDEAAAAYREAAAGDADGSGNVGGTSTASQTTTVSSNDIASTEHEFLVLGLIPKVKNTITLTITDTDGNATTRTIEKTGPETARRGGSTARTGRRPRRIHGHHARQWPVRDSRQ